MVTDATPPIVMINRRYRLHEKLGQGGMGVVYRATDRLNGETVALKQVRVTQEQLQFNSKGSSSDGTLAMAVEFRTLAGLRHPHIVAVLDYGFDQARLPFYAMQLLTDALPITEYGRAVSEAEKARLLIEMLQALAYLHRRGVIHRDLKPGNVQVTPDGVVKVMDFGLALNQTESHSGGGVQGVVGTMAYMAPELFSETSASVASDLYAVGVMAYELFVGKHPFNITNMAMIVMQAMTVEPILNDIPPAFRPIVKRLLAKQPEQRYASAFDVIDALYQALDQPIPPESIPLRESFLQASEFIGRTDELTILRTALDQCFQKQGSGWLVGGESGVGKSRLLEELRTRALIQGALVLRGQAIAEGGSAFQVWRAPLRNLILWLELSDLEAGILKPLVPDIADLLGRVIPDVPDVQGSAAVQRIGFTITDLFQRYCAEHGAVVLLLEDLHWAEESLAPIKSLAPFLTGLPILIIGTYRDDERPKLPESLPDLQPLKLARLSDEAIRDLSISMLGDAGARAEVVDLLKAETEGNLFFMVEVVRALAEQAGSLNAIGQITLPVHVFTGGIRTMVRHRLERLPEAEYALLKLIAVLGRALDLPLTRAILDQNGASMSEAQMNAWLQVCADAAILEVADGGWRFSHDKLREAVIADLTPDERRTLSQRAAVGIEALYPDDERFAAALVDLWEAVGDIPKTLEAMVRLGKQYTAITEYRAMVSMGERGIALSAGVDSALEKRNLVALHHQLSNAFSNLGDVSKAMLHAETYLELARALDDPILEGLSLRMMGSIYIDKSNYDLAESYLQRAITLFQTPDANAHTGNAYNNLGIVAYYRGNFGEAQRYFQKAVVLVEMAGDVANQAGNLINLGSVALAQGKRAEAKACWQEGLAIMRRLGHRRGIAQSLHGLGNIARDEGDFAQARRDYQEADLIFRQIGFLTGEADMLIELSNIATAEGKFKEAKASLTHASSIYKRMNDTRGFNNMENGWGTIAFLEGDYQTAERHFLEMQRHSREIGEEGILGEATLSLAFLKLKRTPKTVEALADLREGIQDAMRLETIAGAISFLIGFGWLRYWNGEALYAAELVSYASGHPAMTAIIRLYYLQPLQAELQALLTPEDYAAALTRGATLDFDAVVADLLAQTWDNIETAPPPIAPADSTPPPIAEPSGTPATSPESAPLAEIRAQFEDADPDQTVRLDCTHLSAPKPHSEG